jgi:hypothetical protein
MSGAASWPASDTAMARYLTPLEDTTDQGRFGYAHGRYVGDERGVQLAWADGGIKGFYTYLSQYPDDRITVALLTDREESPDLGSIARVAAKIAREGS